MYIYKLNHIMYQIYIRLLISKDNIFVSSTIFRVFVFESYYDFNCNNCFVLYSSASPFICALVTCTKFLSAGWVGGGFTWISVGFSLVVGFGVVPFTTLLLWCFATVVGCVLTFCGVCSSICRFYIKYYYNISYNKTN